MPQLPYSSELIIAIQNTFEARSIHLEKQSQCKNFRGLSLPEMNGNFNKGAQPP